VPTDTYTVLTPGGRHLYFQAPQDMVLRNTAGTLGWKVDTRCGGGYVVGAGSRRPEGAYRVDHAGPVAELPGWLREMLAPAPAVQPPPMRLPLGRASAYVRAIVEGEAYDVAAARTGTRHRVLLRAARRLGQLVGGGELAEHDARDALLEAGAGHLGVDGFSTEELTRTVDDGLVFGIQRPRRIKRNYI
jgi:hypothetical protein